jgi:hypothetical protein
MWIVLADATDVVADWAFAALNNRGLTPLYRISPDDLAVGASLTHTLVNGQVSTRLRLTDGTEISDQSLRGVLNRLYGATAPHFRGSSTKDQDYVQQELYALYLSWLYGLQCPVINRPTAQGLSGAWRHEAEWVVLAHKAGLPVAPYRQSSWDVVDAMKGDRRLVPEGVLPTSVIVFGALTIGIGLPANILAGCRRLAALAQTELLGVDFIPDAQGGWTFAGATPMPDWRLGGSLLIEALVARLTHQKALVSGGCV